MSAPVLGWHPCPNCGESVYQSYDAMKAHLIFHCVVVYDRPDPQSYVREVKNVTPVPNLLRAPGEPATAPPLGRGLSRHPRGS